MNKRKPRWFKSLTGIALSITLTVPLLAACAKGENADNQTERVLRIATPYYGGDDEYFRQQFTEVFEFANPNIKVEVVSAMDNLRYAQPSPDQKREDPLERLKELMTGDNPPDVVMMNYDQLPDLIANNMLQPLDPLITKDKFDTSDIVPAVIDGLKSLGDGKLFALAPTFTSQVLMYNKKLFADAGVEPPKDDMTWDEVFDLARRVSKGEGENRKYGFAFSPHAFGGKENLFYEMSAYTAPLQLRVFDDKGETMTVDTDQWEKVWKTMYELSKEKIFPEPIDYRAMEAKREEQFNPFQHDNFLSGRLAMTIASTWNINEVIRANKEAVNNVKGFTPIDWDIVTMPSHPEAKGIGGNVYLNGIMGINAKAQNADDAWRFIKFINGEEWARLKSRSVSQLVSRAKYIQPKDGMTYNITAFYKLKPVPMQNDLNKLFREKPNINQVYYQMGQQYFKQAMDGTLGVREALKQWQTAGDAALKQLKENPNGPINIPMEKAVKNAVTQ